MNFLRRWLRNFALTFSGVDKLLSRASAAVREARVSKHWTEADDLMGKELQFQAHLMRERMNELLSFRYAEVACQNPEAFDTLREAGKIAPTDSVVQFKERLWELELALEDRGWAHETARAMLEFSRYGVQQLIRIIRVYALKNPLVSRASIISRLYVLGRGVEIRCEDDSANDVIQDFLEANKSEMSHIGLAEKITSLQTDGALYFGLATDKSGDVTVTMIDGMEIQDVITDPNDTAKIRYFKRQWSIRKINQDGTQTDVPTKAWYPSLEWAQGADDRPMNFGDTEINWEMPVYRMHGGGSPAKWRWPVPPLYAMIDWARAYKDFLEDWATVQRALARFALMVETKGGPVAVAAYQALLGTTFAEGGTQVERNPPPAVASAHIGGPDTKIAPFKSAGATVAPEQARRLGMQAGSASGLPETMLFGDASTGSLATAQSLDRPTELKFKEMQERLREAIITILQYVLAVAGTTAGNRFREARRRDPAPQPVKISVKFPSILEHDIQTMIQAICYVASMGGRLGIAAGIVDRRTIADLLLAEIGYENRDDLLDQIYGKTYKPAADVTDQRTQVPPQALKTATGKALSDLSIAPPLPPPPPPPGPTPGAAPPAPGPTKESVDRLRETIERLAAHNGR